MNQITIGRKGLLLSVSVLSAAVTLPYILSVYGNVEREVGTWVMLVLFLAAALTATSLMFLQFMVARFISAAIVAGILILQVFPIHAWSAFASLHDVPGPEDFQTHWTYSLPHIVLALFLLLALATSPQWIRDS